MLILRKQNLYLMIKSEWRVIVSRMSGAGKALNDWPNIAKYLEEAKVPFSAKITDHAYHAIELASESVREGYRRLLVIGGDGALHEVLNGIFSQEEVDPSEITLGLIPVGSGNDWSRMHNIPMKYRQAVAVIADSDKYTIRQDVCRVSTLMDGKPYCRYMVNIGGLGFDSDVCRRFDIAKSKGNAGDKQYLKSLISGFLSYRCLPFKVKVDGQRFFEGKAFSVAFGIGKYCGGGMMQTPEAIPDDGLLEVTVIKKLNKAKFLSKVPALFEGTIYKYEEAIHTRGTHIEVDAVPYSFIEVDGEVIGRTPVTLDIIPSAINVVSRWKSKA